MACAHRILISSLFTRDVKQYIKKDSCLKSIVERAKNILESDPHNMSRQHDIKKLEGLKVGEGVFRLRIRDYRIRYDIIGSDIILYSFRHRKEAYR